MRVLFVDQFSEPGGAQLVLRDILTEALQRGWRAEFMAPGNGALFDFCGAHRIPSHHLPLGVYTNGGKKIREVFRYGVDMARAARVIRSVVSRNSIDLVVANGPRIAAAAAMAPCPVVFAIHSRVDKTYARRILHWSLRRRPATVVCCSKFVAAPLAPMVNPESMHVIYNGVADLGYVEERPRDAVRRIAIVGRIAPEKGHLDFVRAAQIVAERRPGVRFTIHGTALFSDPAFGEKVRANAPAGIVEFHGWTDDIARVLHESDILVVPSAAVEATPRVIMEALSAGTPIIAYPSGGIPELIRHGETGLLTASSDGASLARSIEYLLSDSELMRRLARNGRREWDRRFRLERFLGEICDLLERAPLRACSL